MRVAIVHDYLNQRGGAERVALELAATWPDAPIYTTLYRPGSTFDGFTEHDVKTSWIDAVPTDSSFRTLFPLYPSAIRSLGVLDHDVVLTSSSGWAHGIRTSPATAHVVYCHTPARWLYRPEAYLGAASWQQRLAQPLLRGMRRWDRSAAARADVYVANSYNTRDRIREVYDLEAEVVHPPVDVERFSPRPRGDRFLVVSRLLDYKRVDAVIQAANAGRVPLDVVGTGPSFDALCDLAGPTVTMHGRLDDDEVTEAMESCRAFVVAGDEDFGIVSVEAQAAGKPVVAFAAGGSLETVVDGVTGTFFESYDPADILAALRRADEITTSPEEIARVADRFSAANFRERMCDIVAEAATERARSQRVGRFERAEALYA